MHHEEAGLLRREVEIRQRLSDCARLARRCGPGPEIQRLERDYSKQLNHTLRELDAVRLLRPFPVE